MINRAPFQPGDLAELDATLLSRALAVVTMEAVHDGQRHPELIGLRHDVDNSIEPAVDFARWEHDHGYRSTYYILHTAPYWQDKPLLRRSLETIVAYGHEIGIHNNALAEAYSTGLEPRAVLAAAIAELRDYGFTIRSTVAHGDGRCRDNSGDVRFVNDEIFTECPRPHLGSPTRTIGTVPLRQSALADFGLEFDANWIGRTAYLSDSGGVWSQPFGEFAAGFPFDGQAHLLIHPDWWSEAFTRAEIAA